jgi:hypothetical protein
MSTPSLLNVPYRLKAGTLYSQIPETGLGDFAVTRSASNVATRINSLGFIERVNDGVPRLDYPLGGAVNGCPALLVEPSAQNLVIESEAFNTGWSTQAGATVTPNTIAAPDNNVTADTINLTTTSESRVQRGSITIANSTTYTMSCFYKNIALTAGETFRMRFNNTNSAPNNFVATAVIDLAAGTATYSLSGTSGTGFSGTATGRVDNYGNGWYRFSMTFTAGTAGGTATGIFEVGNNTSGALRSFYAWGAQLEVGSVATSYIPTTTASITRAADVITKTGVSSLIGQTEGTIYAEVDIRNIAKETYIIRIDDGATSNIVSLRTLTSNVVRTAITAPTTSGTINISSAAFTAGIVKIAFAYKSGEIALSVNGATAVTTNGTFAFGASLSRVNLGGNAGSSELNDRIRAAALYPTRISDAELALLTA